jgi:dinuclear metal center YbgI/SA1388 family protein
MVQMKALINKLEKLAPPTLAEEWDNVGLMMGSKSTPITKVLCALDVNEQVVEEAILIGAECIVTHHPFFFKGMKRIDYDTSKGALIQKIVQEGIQIYSMHTNLDIVQGGMNDFLAKGLLLKNIKVLSQTTPTSYEGIGRVGDIATLSLRDLSNQVKTFLGTSFVRVVGDLDAPIDKVAICSGSGSQYIKEAAGVADVYITGDIKFHEAQMAVEEGLFLIDAGHYATENIMMPVVAKYIESALEGVLAVSSKINAEMFQTI